MHHFLQLQAPSSCLTLLWSFLNVGTHS
jgi:hypothetical protein